MQAFRRTKDMLSESRRWVKYIPNAITLGALCLGLFNLILCAGPGSPATFVTALLLLSCAVILDVCDGLCARRLNAESITGAYLDSAADFVNFGLVPALFLYQWSLSGLGMPGLLLCCVYALATGFRLIRFTSSHRTADARFFEGLPSPAAAFLCLTPAILPAANGFTASGSHQFIILAMTAAALLMVSSLKTPKLIFGLQAAFTFILYARGR